VLILFIDADCPACSELLPKLNGRPSAVLIDPEGRIASIVAEGVDSILGLMRAAAEAVSRAAAA